MTLSIHMYPAGNTGYEREIPGTYQDSSSTQGTDTFCRLDRVLIIVSSEGSLAGQFVPNNWIIRSIMALQGNLCIVCNQISSITTPFVIKSFLTCFTGCMLKVTGNSCAHANPTALNAHANHRL